ncbi:zinc metalloprotease HtpX [Candidatus Kaiserbacteria bacterium RIFCSPHIGHO2_02_FULL_55_20]|uniref:Protease HtpX homolog n=1 Tax=Candidatus Kaiserbacteria bacterium RIFCSPHIGHO2_02_FULL_55_20 TaxID=1798497 RepID=A0A1F6DWN3_9BACT|nr:MAG: zinc metalloprotease HtpX [Candidatus Kaiserbacteria bacterium RIFCSPHIGHO2_01_FULL_55_37]OGG65690.1 MAG: zinc metalloprotease HtpX [Candidatus Kaiserbacteria bacterium RIFCSPHIGHO2_02_FULL_55_20]
MATLYTQQGKNVFRTWMLMGVFLALVIGVGFVMSQYYGNSGILYIAVAFSIVMNVSAYWFSDKVAIASAGAKPADEKEYLELHRIVENLAITAGLPKPRVYIINDAAPNAFASGRDAKHAVIAVTTGLLLTLDRPELEGVLAHELSHVGNRDILVMTVAVVLVGFLAVISDIALRMSMFGGNRDRDNKNPIMLIAVIAAMILAPIAAKLIQLAISRKREFLADASGALLTRYPDGLASALTKIGAYSAPMQRASSATAHLFISNPFGAQKAGAFVAKMFSTHPPMQERIAALRGMDI